MYLHGSSVIRLSATRVDRCQNITEGPLEEIAKSTRVILNQLRAKLYQIQPQSADGLTHALVGLKHLFKVLVSLKAASNLVDNEHETLYAREMLSRYLM